MIERYTYYKYNKGATSDIHIVSESKKFEDYIEDYKDNEIQIHFETRNNGKGFCACSIERTNMKIRQQQFTVILDKSDSKTKARYDYIYKVVHGIWEGTVEGGRDFEEQKIECIEYIDEVFEKLGFRDKDTYFGLIECIGKNGVYMGDMHHCINDLLCNDGFTILNNKFYTESEPYLYLHSDFDYEEYIRYQYSDYAEEIARGTVKHMEKNRFDFLFREEDVFKSMETLFNKGLEDHIAHIKSLIDDKKKGERVGKWIMI